jgi:alpha-1,6-mannosyltransferase
MHLVDTTLFYSPTSGGVERYLTAKHAWLKAHTSWEHTILVPGREAHMQRGAVSTIPGYPVPGTFNYRLPLNPGRWVRLLDELEPSLIEAGDAFHPARSSARRRPPRHRARGLYHSNLPQIISSVPECCRHRRRCHALVYERCDVVFAPSRLMCAYLHDMGVRYAVHQPWGGREVFSPQRRTQDPRERLGPGRHARAHLRRALLRGEEPAGTAAGVRAWAPPITRFIGGDRAARPASNVTMVLTAVTASSWPSGSPRPMRSYTPGPRRPLGW